MPFKIQISNSTAPVPADLLELATLIRATWWQSQDGINQIATTTASDVVTVHFTGSHTPPSYSILRNEKGIVLAFGGTANGSHWQVNLAATPIHDNETGLKFHAGWLNSWRNIRPQIFQHLSNLPANHAITITGHSMGAAIAAVASQDIVRQFGANRIRLITFAQPRVVIAGGPWISPSIHWRINNDRDFVEDVPPNGLNIVLPQSDLLPPIYGNSLVWDHDGIRYELHEDGDLIQMNPTSQNNAMNPSLWGGIMDVHVIDEYINRLQDKAKKQNKTVFASVQQAINDVVSSIPNQSDEQQVVSPVPYTDYTQTNELIFPTQPTLLTPENISSANFVSVGIHTVSNGNSDTIGQIFGVSKNMIQCTIEMQIASTFGFTESHYLPAGTSLSDALTATKQLANKRKEILGGIGSNGSGPTDKGDGNAFVKSVRVQDTSVNNDGFIEVYKGNDGLSSIGASTWASDFGERSVVCKLWSSTGKTAIKYLRGLPDLFFNNAVEFVPTGPYSNSWKTAYTAYGNHLVNNGFGMRVKALAPRVPFVQASFENNMWKITRPNP